MLVKSPIYFSILIFITLLQASCYSSYSKSDLETVEFVDLSKYIGTWYEIARIDNSFQKQCLETRATYTQQDNYIDVLNECRTIKGKLDQAHGRAFITDEDSNSKLKVSFVPFFKRFGLFSGDYWIIELDENYQFAVVGHPERKFLWILSRSPTLDKTILDDIFINLENKHNYDTSEIILTPSWSK